MVYVCSARMLLTDLMCRHVIHDCPYLQHDIASFHMLQSTSLQVQGISIPSDIYDVELQCLQSQSQASVFISGDPGRKR